MDEVKRKASRREGASESVLHGGGGRRASISAASLREAARDGDTSQPRK